MVGALLTSCSLPFMANALIVMTRGSGGTWAVYLEDDSPREPGTLVRTTGPLVGSISSWEQLDSLAARYDIGTHQVDGAGLAEMEQVLGAKP
jgi:hypothetical protein